MAAKKSKSSITATVNEYTFGLHTLNLGDRIRRAQNPFTGEPIEFHIDDGMSKSELAAVRDLLKKAGASRPDDDGYRYLSLSNGTHAVGLGRLFEESTGPIQSIKVELLTKKDFSITEASFVVQLASAGNLFISSSVDPDVVVTIDPVNDPPFAKRHRDHSIVADAKELSGWVQKNISYRKVLDTGGKTLGEVIDELSEP